MTYTVGIDVGGTFTDCVVVDQAGTAWMDKSFTTPEDLSEGIIDALRNTCGHLGIEAEKVLQECQVFGVGTTSLINRVVSRRGARVGLITTKGHEDAVLIGRVVARSEGLAEQNRFDVAAWNKPEPLFVPGSVRGVTERIDSLGTVVASLNEAEVLAAISDLKAIRVDSIAVALLWSFLNPTHEQRVRDLINQAAPEIAVNISSEISPSLGEFERTNTTLLNAYLAPGAANDFAQMERRLQEYGLGCGLLLMQSNGGLAWANELQRKPVYGLAAGPIGGVVGVQKLARAASQSNVVCTDMGGTSFDAGLIIDGQPIFSSQSIIERHRIQVPSIEVTSIGAGGGSIATVDELTGELHVGPRSAGSTPGPVCYGNGGIEPTVTDANVVLGRIDPRSFWGGRRELDWHAAVESIQRRIAEPLGIDCQSAAAGIIDIVDARMADLLRTMTIATGRDPRDFVLYAYGGAGPVHVGSYARQLGASLIVVPLCAPVQSAFGIAIGNFSRHLSQSQPMKEPYDSESIDNVIEQLISQARHDWESAGLDPNLATYQTSVDMRFSYQVHEIRVPIEAGAGQIGIIDGFVDKYEDSFGSGAAFRSAGTEMLTFHLVSTLPAANYKHSIRSAEGRPAPSPGKLRKRDVFFEGQMVQTPVMNFMDLPPDQSIDGPVIIESANTTVVVHPGQSAMTDHNANLLVRTQ